MRRLVFGFSLCLVPGTLASPAGTQSWRPPIEVVPKLDTRISLLSPVAPTAIR
jgi:hypothetical protein